MKVEIEDKKYNFITDNSKEINSNGAFLVTEQNKIYKKEVEENGYAIFLTPEEVFEEWSLGEVKIIGVTGTNGKTSVTNIVAHILKNFGKKVAVSGTEGIFLHSKNGIEKIVERGNTTPDIFKTLLNLKKAKESGAEFFVMEVSSHGIFQKRIEGLRFAAKVFTNLTQDHLDFHKTFKNYCEVKSSFFEDKDSVKIINSDDENIKFNKKNSHTYSLKKNADLFSKNSNFENGIFSEVFFEDKKFLLNSAMVGKFNLYNILASVLTVKKITEFSLEEILKKVKSFSGVDGRMEVVYKQKKAEGSIDVFIDYAHTPDAIENVLRSVSENKKIIAVVGAGGDRDSKKRAPMAKISCENSDLVFITSDNPRFENPQNILDDMKSGVESFSNYQIIKDRKEAIFKALTLGQKDFENGRDVIIAILGKGNEDYLDIEGLKVPYSDKEEVFSFFN
jgi:UDP-N-acetylmuramoyl-L-alanyl-D-glutamate--2,6-diaminopimelate ligase